PVAAGGPARRGRLPVAGPGRGAGQGARGAGGRGHPVWRRGGHRRAAARDPGAARVGGARGHHERAQAQLRLPLLDDLRGRGAGDVQRRRARPGRQLRRQHREQRGKRAARPGRADDRRGRLLLRRSGGRREVRAAGTGAGMRRATRLDKARWLIVYSTDFVFLLGLTGLVMVYATWQGGMPVPLVAAAAVLDVLIVVAGMRVFRLAVRGAPRPTRTLVVAGVAALLLTPFAA